MAKQTFTTGQVLTAAQMTSLQQTAMLGGAANAKVASYVLVATDAGDSITMSNASPTTITVNTGLFAEGDIVTIINLGAGACTITAGTATVDTSGSLVLATNQGGVLRFTSASAAIFFQFATPASGDIEGVTAGTGISGGGTSGTVTITNSMATAIDAKGDLIVGTGADTFSRLAVGSDTYTLVADSSTATGLKWAAPAGGGGKVLQVVSTSYTTEKTISSTSYTDTDLTLSITPTSATSKILVLVGQAIKHNNAASPSYVWVMGQLLRGATVLLTDFTNVLQAAQSTAANLGSSMYMGYSYLDSPNTTSSTTYKTQAKYSTNSSGVVVQYNGTPSTMTLMEIGA